MLILKGYEIKYQTMGYSVMVARLILVQSVRVQILVPQPLKLTLNYHRQIESFCSNSRILKPLLHFLRR